MVRQLFFDEIATEIDGEGAEVMARKIQRFSSHHRVFCIINLLENADRGNTYFIAVKLLASLGVRLGCCKECNLIFDYEFLRGLRNTSRSSHGAEQMEEGVVIK